MTGTPQPDPTPQTDPQPEPQPTPEPAPTPPAEPKSGGKTPLESLPADVQDYIRSLREEAKTTRTKAEEAESQHQTMLDSIAMALGLKPEDDPAEVAKTAASERDAARSEVQALRVEIAVMKAAAKGGVNVEALTDSRTFMRQLADLDPAADDFAARLEAAIGAAVEANPTLKVAESNGAPRAPKAQGGQGGGAPAQLRAEDLEHMTPAEINKARDEGRLADLLRGYKP